MKTFMVLHSVVHTKNYTSNYVKNEKRRLDTNITSPVPMFVSCEPVLPILDIIMSFTQREHCADIRERKKESIRLVLCVSINRGPELTIIIRVRLVHSYWKRI